VDTDVAARAAVELAIQSGLRLLAAALGAWLALSTAASIVRRAVPRLRGRARLDALTLPIVRRALDLVLAATLGAALPAPSAGAAPAPPKPARITHVAIVAASASRPDVAVVRAPQPTPVPPAPSWAPSAFGVAPHEHVVVRGDNLWTIARAEVMRRGLTGPSDRDVARYWARVVAVNRARLRSGNPSIIFPGEVIVLPS
jgi:nucleoid-associated protein YgaU